MRRTRAWIRCATVLYRSKGGHLRRRRPQVTAMDHDDDLHDRLAALEARAPVDTTPPPLPSRRRRGRFAVPIALAPVFVLAIVATAAAGAVIVSNLDKGRQGDQNPG